MLRRKIGFLAGIIFFSCLIIPEETKADSFGSLVSDLDKGQWMMSLEGYGTIQRDLKYSDGKVEAGYGGVFHGRGYGITDRLNIFAKLGYHDVDVDPNPFKNKKDSLKGGMAGGLYLKEVVYKNPVNSLEIGIGAGFLFCSAHHCDGPAYDWREWQLGAYMSREFERFVPYAGFKYCDMDSRLKFKQKETDLSGGYIDVESDKKTGVFIGTNINLNEDKDVYLNCEVNFISSLEIGTGLFYKF